MKVEWRSLDGRVLLHKELEDFVVVHVEFRGQARLLLYIMIMQ